MVNVSKFTPPGKPVNKTTAVSSQNWYAACMKTLFLFPILMDNDTSSPRLWYPLGCFDAALKNFDPNSLELDTSTT